MDNTRSRRWSLLGVLSLALTIGVMVRRSSRAPRLEIEVDVRDAVAAVPASPAVLGGARVAQPNASGYFAVPSMRRAEAEAELMSSRLARAMKPRRVRAAKRRAPMSASVAR